VLLGGLEYSPDFLAFAAAARQMGSKLLMDCQHREATLQTEGVIEALRAVDVFTPNLCEACKLTGLLDVEEAARQLAGITPLVVVKLGAQGALAAQGEQVVRVEGIHVKSVVDTTGAGDCFNAGFLYGYLKGESLESCLRYANLLGGISVTGHGVSQIPAREQVEALVAQYDALVAGEIDLPRQPGLGWSFKVKR
jgi:sugar/nucleoside kinase (ribokinase family)